MTKAVPQSVREYYDAIIAEHGPVPQGVGWRNKESQYLKFEQLYRIVDKPQTPFSINELGCGYGAFVDFLDEKQARATYLGHDISPQMIDAARAHLEGGRRSVRWSLHLNEPMTPADYTITSGIFNANIGENGAAIDKDEWEKYILATLDEMNDKSLFGFSFNMQTTYSDYFTQYYYGDPCFYFDHCMKRYSRHVALLHDYKLFDFTILVTKERRG